MPDYADLLMRLYRQDDESYGFELRYYLPNSVIEVDSVSSKVSVASLEALEGASIEDPQAYGSQLKAALFADPTLKSYEDKVLGNIQSTDHVLRLRLQIPPELPQLHSLRWETMPGLDGARSVASDQNHPFSRFLAMEDWRGIELRPKSELRALIVVSNPNELEAKGAVLNTHLAAADAAPETIQLDRVNVAGEISRARAALQGVRTIDELESRAPDRRPTLQNIKNTLNQGYDILYLACHGALIAEHMEKPVGPDNPRTARLVLEDADGSLAYPLVHGSDLADAIKLMLANNRPRLVVLASCQSGGDGRSVGGDALAALGPLLVRAGVPAVVAMQGDVLMETAEKFIPTFFRGLLQHGMLDQAMAHARMAIDEQEDWWAPVLYTCLRGGQLLYDLGFGEPDLAFNLWPALIQNIRRVTYNERDEKVIEYTCTPVIGPDLSEFLMGSPREIARQWADPANFEQGQQFLGSLPSVASYLSANPYDLPYFAQYLAVQQTHEFVPGDMVRHLRGRLVKQNQAELPDEILADAEPSLRRVIAALGRRQHLQKSEAYAYHILASLPFKIYINANPDNLLEEALISHGRNPVVEYFHWNPRLAKDPYPNLSAFSDYQPSEERPLIFHMFGDFRSEKSLVLTEDDYFEYLVNVNRGYLPDVIETILSAHTLLFLGFRLSDWSFRVLFHSLLDEDRKLARHSLLQDNKSIAVQIQPSDQVTRQDVVRKFLENYLPPEFKIFWGPADLFLRELWEKYPKNGVYPCQISPA